MQASRDLDIGENVLRRWIREFSSEHDEGFPGQGQVRPEQQEIDRLRRRSPSWLYVAAVIDLFSRRVVGWSRSAKMAASWSRMR